MNRLLFTITCLLLTVLPLKSQKLNHVLGQFIIEVDEVKDITTLKRKLVSIHPKFPFQFTQITSEPLNLWLIETDYRISNEYEILKNLQKENLVKKAQFNHLIEPRKVPNDPLFTSQWQFLNTGIPIGVANADLDIDLAWDIATGGVTASGDTIVVCVIDNGLEQHPDYVDNLWVNRGEIPGDLLDNDGNGFIDDISGWNAFQQNNNIFTDNSHGTAVSGIIGAKGNNNIGISGVNWDVKIMFVNYGSATEANALRAYAYPLVQRKLYNTTGGQKGAFVVVTNTSWGVDGQKGSDAPIWCSFYDSLGKAGIINVAATTNDSKNVDEVGDIPTNCTSEYLLGVNSLTRSETLAPSGVGPLSVDIAAYGSSVFTTLTPGKYGNDTGTSFAAPQVSGAIALLYSIPCNRLSLLARENPEAAALAVRDLILESAVELPFLKGKVSSNGKLNIKKLLDAGMRSCDNCASPLAISLDATTLKQIKISWLSKGISTAVDLRFRKLGAPDWSQIDNISNGLIIQNVDFCDYYEFQFKTRCNTQVISDFHHSRFVIGGGCCAPPQISTTLKESALSIKVLNDEENISNQILEVSQDLASPWDTIYFTGNIDYPISDQCNIFYYRITNICDRTSNRSIDNAILGFSSNCESCTENTYCIPEKSSNNAEWIAEIKIENLTLVSGSDENGFGAYMGKATPIVEKGDSVNLSVVLGYAGTKYNEYVAIYIDYDQDGYFDDNERVVYEQGVLQTLTKKILISKSAITGVTRMRVKMSYKTIVSACEKIEFGETEDHCIQIKGTVSNHENEEVNYSLSAYPNPFSSSIQYQLTAPTSGKGIVVMYDYSLRKVVRQEIEWVQGENLYELNTLDNFASGVYLLQINGQAWSKTLKLIKI